MPNLEPTLDHINRTWAIARAKNVLCSGIYRNMDWPAAVVSDDVAQLARAWAVDTFGIPNIRKSTWATTDRVFFFKYESDLILFNLKWS